MKYLIVTLGLLLLASCSNNKLEMALDHAGENRAELEKVLEHYAEQGDEQKLRAAEFLIENMPGHFYFDDEATDGYFSKIDAKFAYEPYYMKYAFYSMISLGIPNPGLAKEDIHHITSEFLIRHIDRSFEKWRSLHWFDEVPFETFLEYLLPYRVDMEPLDRIVAKAEKPDRRRVDRVFNGSNTEMTETHEMYIINMHEDDNAGQNRMSTFTFTLPDNSIKDLSHKFNCTQIAVGVKKMYDHAGFPTAIDFSPYWSRINLGHFWNTLLEPNLGEVTIGYQLKDRCGKVYRRTYSRHATPVRYSDDEYIPFLFLDPFCIDVTAKYVNVADVGIDVSGIEGRKPRNVYLCTFNQGDWQPLAIGARKWKKGVFENIGTDNVYLPVYYDGHTRKSITYPFHLSTAGDVEFMVPADEKTDMRLTRKYYSKPGISLGSVEMEGVTVWGCESADDKGELLHTIVGNDLETIPYINIEFPAGSSYRYIRLEPNSKQDSQAFLSQIDILDAGGEVCPVVDVKANLAHPMIRTDILFDNNMMSSFSFSDDIVMDIGKSTELSGMNIITWNDDNYIVPGEEYELFYHDEDGWVSLGRQTAENIYLDYTDVPAGALYLLRNHTKGVEERPFAYENGRMVFW